MTRQIILKISHNKCKMTPRLKRYISLQRLLISGIQLILKRLLPDSHAQKAIITDIREVLCISQIGYV